MADVQLITLLQAKLIKSLSTGGFSRENSKHVVLFFTLKIKKKKKVMQAGRINGGKHIH